MVFSGVQPTVNLPTREELNPIANQIINELPDEESEPVNPEEPVDEEEESEAKATEIIGLEAGIDSTNPYIYKAIEVTVLEQTFTLGDEQLTELRITLGANEKTSTINCVLVDSELKIADAFFTFSRANGGIKLPAEFGSQTTTTSGGGSSADPGSPTGSVNLDDIPNGLKGDELAKVIVQYCKDTSKGNVTDNFQIAAILGTCEIESSMGEFLSEIGGESASYAPWYGRGLVQVTFEENYQKVGERLGLGANFFTDNPDELTNLKYAVPSLILGMRDGWYTSTKLADCSTFDETRNIVNPGETGTRRQNYISYCEKWQGRLDGGEFQYDAAQYNYGANDGSQALQIPNIYPPDELNQQRQFIENQFPTQSRRPTEPGGRPSSSPNLPTQNRQQPSRFPQFPPSGSERFPTNPDTNDPTFPGSPFPGEPNNPDDPVNPQPGQPTDPVINPDQPTNPTDPTGELPPEQETETVTPTVTGNEIKLTVTTINDKVFTFTFILTDDSVNELPSAKFSFSGKSIRYQLDVEEKTENFEDVTPQEYFRILAARYSLSLVDNTTSTQRERLDLIDQRNKTDNQVALEVAEDNELNVIDNPAENTIEIEDKNQPKKPTKIVVTDIINIEFSDQGVTTEEPLYPVTLEVFTTDEILALKPEDSINLDNVYSFIPDSLKKDTWLINTINHDFMTEVSVMELTKYIPKPVTSGGVTVGGGQLSEAQILEKYKSAVVKVGGASGCFVSADGYILTAAHMSGSTDIKTLDGQSYQAREVDIVESNDIMLMKVEASGVPFAPIAPDTSIYTKGGKVAITKIGHGISSEDGAGEGGQTPKDWDATTSFVREIADSWRGLTGGVVVADDKEIDFVNPGDSGCPWFDPYGLIVSCTSGGDRTHQEGAGKKDSSWGGDVKNIIAMLDKNNVSYTKGTRQTATQAPGGGGGTGGDGKVPGWTNPNPTGVLTSGFGLRDAPTSGASSNHKGVDLAGGDGTPILAAADGTVVDADNDTNGSGYGIYVVIKHANNIGSLYGHLKSKSVNIGDTVTMGQQIGQEDNTGTSTGSHLHFGIAEGMTGDNIWSSGTFVDPLNYIAVSSYNRYAVDSFNVANLHGCIIDLDAQNQERFRRLRR